MYTLEVDGEHIPYTLRRSRRARNLLLHVDLDGTVELVVPWYVPFREGLRFIAERKAWLMEQRNHQTHKRTQRKLHVIDSGSNLPVFGETVGLILEIDPTRKKVYMKEDAGQLTVKVGKKDVLRSKLVRWYKHKALEFFIQEVRDISEKMGVGPVHTRINAAKTQWGSCNKTKRLLSFNWRLALAPKEVAQYVVAHEAAHLVHANHSKRFWQTVRELHPEFEMHRQWLRAHGHTLSL